MAHTSDTMSTSVDRESEMSANKYLNIRNVDEDVARKFSAGATVRGLTQAEYLGLLVELREMADLAMADWESCNAIHNYYKRMHDWLVTNRMGSQWA